jgi:surfactin synthase thioesterase subunit
MTSDLWIRRFHPAPSAPVRLVALPHAGGSASWMFPVSAQMSPAVEVLAVQYPGRQDRRHEPVPGSIAELADGVVAALKPFLDKPIALFGHSMGSMVGYEVGLRLQRAGRPPVRLFASGRRAPSRRRDENVHTRDDAGVLAELKRLSGSDMRVLGDPELLPMILPAVRGDYRAVETYHATPGERLDVPVTVLTGDADPMTTMDEAQAWREHTTADCAVHIYPGGHFFLTDHAPAILALMKRELSRTPQRV